MRHLNIPLPELENQSFDPEILDSLQNHPLELKLIQIIKENNRLTYFSDTDRFPNVESLEKTLQTWNISYERDFLNLILWVMSSSFVILPITFTEKPTKFSDYHFVETSYMNLKKTYEYFYHKIEVFYREIYGKIFEEKNLKNILFIDPILYNFKNQKEYLIYIYAKNYEILKEFLEKLDRDPNFMSFAEISKRKLYVISKLKEKYTFLYKKEEKIIPKRAIDDPKWKEIEKSPRIEWDMVLNTFGTNMVIRILLRRQDYELLKKMIEEKKIFSKDDLNYILESMQKIVEHGDLKPEKMDDYESLKKYIKNLL